MLPHTSRRSICTTTAAIIRHHIHQHYSTTAAAAATRTSTSTSTSTSTNIPPQPVPVLPDATLSTFKQHAFDPALPALLPRGHFSTLPAITKWFTTSPSSPTTTHELNTTYLLAHGATTPVQLELTHPSEPFTQLQAPLSLFLSFCSSPSPTPSPTPAPTSSSSLDSGSSSERSSSNPSIYLAQTPLSSLPPPLLADLPTPSLVHHAGRGDMYATSLWLGRAPTYTPLHRDPNPNLFVQMAGVKRVRVMGPGVGAEVFGRVRERVGGTGNGRMRYAEEMMEGRGREVLERVVWGDGEEEMMNGEDGEGWRREVFECHVKAGDALFIPKGWWHSVKGIGEGMTGSVNWWFR